MGGKDEKRLSFLGEDRQHELAETAGRLRTFRLQDFGHAGI